MSIQVTGKFIAVEGLDGSGLTTQAKRLADFLREKGGEVLYTKEHTLKAERASDVASEIEAILNGEREATAKELQDLFIEDREWHIENTIEPALNDGKDVVCDRYKFSTIAYGTASGVDKEYLVSEQEDFLKPDLTILLEVPPRVCAKRIKERGDDITIFEEKSKLKEIWEVYKELRDEYDMEVVDGTSDVSTKEESIKEVSRRVQSVVREELSI